jgi:excisionase family DNA binding protein
MLVCDPVSSELYTTLEVAKMTGIPRATLQFWISTKKIPAPRLTIRNGKAVRLWNKAQIEKIRKLEGTLKPGPKGEEKG